MAMDDGRERLAWGATARASEESGVSVRMLRHRMYDLGMTLEEAMQAGPPKKRRIVALDEAARASGIHRSVLYARVRRRGMTLEEAVAMGPPGARTSVKRMALEAGMNYSTVQSRIRSGMALEDALRIPAMRPGRKAKHVET